MTNCLSSRWDRVPLVIPSTINMRFRRRWIFLYRWEKMSSNHLTLDSFLHDFPITHSKLSHSLIKSHSCYKWTLHIRLSVHTKSWGVCSKKIEMKDSHSFHYWKRFFRWRRPKLDKWLYNWGGKHLIPRREPSKSWMSLLLATFPPSGLEDCRRWRSPLHHNCQLLTNRQRNSNNHHHRHHVWEGMKEKVRGCIQGSKMSTNSLIPSNIMSYIKTWRNEIERETNESLKKWKRNERNEGRHSLTQTTKITNKSPTRT